MDGPEIEPRTVLWAVAEVLWEAPAGNVNHASATLEDTSRSGACIRLKAPVQVGSRVTVKWHREQFSAVARNCRQDGREFLLGVRREPDARPLVAEREFKQIDATRLVGSVEASPAIGASGSAVSLSRGKTSDTPLKNSVPGIITDRSSTANRTRFTLRSESVSSVVRLKGSTHPRNSFPLEVDASPERNAMPPKKLFSKFWRTPPDAAAPKDTHTEAPMNKPNSQPAESATDPRADLLSYEDIYHAAGILNPPSGYGIQKVVDMLNSERLRDLAKEVKRASVLMALDAAGTSLDDLLRDATRRQQALDSYASSRRTQLEEFEAHKSQENAQIEAEMERLRAHYAERIQKNREQIDQEKAALRNWQGAMQHESQRIAEVLELCEKQTAAPVNSLLSSGGSSSSIDKSPSEKTTGKAAHA
jgi:hypothetical protein